MRKFNVAVVGATGAVGEELFRVLEEYNFPINKLIPLASSRSAGSKVEYKNKEITVFISEEKAVPPTRGSRGGEGVVFVYEISENGQKIENVKELLQR